MIAEPLDGELLLDRLSSGVESLTLSEGVWELDTLELDGLVLLEGADLRVANASVSGGVTLASGASLDTTSPNAGEEGHLDVGGDLVLGDGATYLGERVAVGGDLTLEPGAVLGVSRTDRPGTLSTLDLAVTGTLHVREGARIDLDGRGYPERWRGPDYRRGSRGERCHGGRGGTSEACEYGGYRDARFAGSGGYYDDARGGGYAHVRAGTLIVDGIVSANATGSRRYGAAGGGLRLEADHVGGAPGGTISANGADTYEPGAGGRISVRADSDDYAGSIEARAGTDTSGAVGGTGAGTVYREIGGSAGELIVDNGGQAAGTGSTEVRSVGRHAVASAVALGDGRWELTRAHLAERFEGDLVQGGETGMIGYHLVELAERTKLDISLENARHARIRIYRNDGALEAADRVQSFHRYSYTSGSSTFTLDAGRYIVSVADYTIGEQDAVDGYTNGGVSSSNYPLGEYELDIVEHPHWPTSEEANGGYGLQGLRVSLDADDEAAELHTVLSNGAHTLIVASERDLADAVGREMIGVHELEWLAVRAGASLSFGEDRLHLTRDDSLELDAGSTLQTAELSTRALRGLLAHSFDGVVHPRTLGDETLSLTLGGGAWRIDSLRIGELVLADGASLDVPDLTLTGDLTLQGSSTLTTRELVAGGDVAIESGATLGGTAADVAARRIDTVALNVTGTLHVHAGATIDVDGLGYPEGYAGPNHTDRDRAGLRCHGGRTVSATACEHGGYRRAEHAGSGGDSGGGAGGGHLVIRADTLLVDGLISANGDNDSTYSAAGGGVDIEARSIGGGSAGVIRANGGASTRPGSGGRVSLAVAVDAYAGDVQAQSGVDTDLGDGERSSGAGTVFWREVDGAGRLVVDNGGQGSVARGTSTRAVGRHVVGAVESLGENLWRIHPSAANHRFEGVLAASGALGSIAYHELEVPEGTPMRVDLAREFRSDDDVVVYRDDGDLGVDDEILRFNLYGSRLSRTFELDAGRYIVALARWTTPAAQFVAGYPNAGVSHVRTSSAGGYELAITQQGIWTPSDADGDGVGLRGLQVSLDARDGTSPLRTIVSNDALSIVVESDEDLGEIVGNDMVGVHRLSELEVRGGASLSFGNDRVSVSGLSSDAIAAGTELSVGSFDGATYARLGTHPQQGTIDQDRLSIAAELALGAGTWTFGDVDVRSLTLGDGATLLADSVRVAEDLSMESGARLSTELPGEASGAASALRVEVGDELRVALGAHIDLDGRGYASDDGPTVSAAYYRCHGGRTHERAECEYGRHDAVGFAGAGGAGAGLRGGGFALIDAGSMIVDGRISADAVDSAGALGAGAGGGLRVVADRFSGSGEISADGGSGALPGAGGRVALELGDTSAAHAVEVRAAAGTDTDLSDGVSAGAGTVFVGASGGVGDLRVDNAAQRSLAHGTTLPSIGRHVVARAERLDEARWTVERVAYASRSIRARAESETDLLFHPFAPEAHTSLDIRLDSDAWWDQEVRVFRRSDATTLGERVSSAFSGAPDESGVVESRFDLPAGDYVVVAAWTVMLDSEIVAAFDGDLAPDRAEVDEEEGEGADTYGMRIEERAPWRADGGRLVGLWIDLDPGDEDGPLHRVVSATASTLTIESADDLSDRVGRAFVGVRRFGTLRVLDGAWLDLGSDRVIITAPGGLDVSSGATLSVGELDEATRQGLLESPQGGTILLEGARLEQRAE